MPDDPKPEPNPPAAPPAAPDPAPPPEPEITLEEWVAASQACCGKRD